MEKVNDAIFFLIMGLYVLFVIVFSIIQLPFTPIVKLLTGKWILEHFNNLINKILL